MAFIRRLYGEYVFILIVLLSGMGATTWLAWEQQNKVHEETVAQFKSAAQDRIELIHEKIQYNNIVLRSLAAFFRSSEHITREEFSIFTGQLLKDYTYINALEWIPHVPQSQRKIYEENADYSNFSFTEIDEQLVFSKAKERKEYFPIYYVEPIHDNLRVLGFDIASDQKRFKALQTAIYMRETSVTSRVTLLQKDDKQIPGIIFFEPVFAASPLEDPINTARIYGVIGSVVPLSEMIDAAIRPLNYVGVNIVIHDLSANNPDDKLLYVRSTRLLNIPEEEIINDYASAQNFIEKSILDVGGRRWQISILPARGFFNVSYTKDTYFIFFGGLIFTLLLVSYMYSRIRENERISEEVYEQTEKLSKAKKEMEMILLSTNEGITGLDPNGMITFCNLKASQILKYNKRDLIGKHHHSLLHNKHPNGDPYDVEDCPIQKILDYGQPCNVRDEVFWNKDFEPVQVEYTGSPIYEGGDVTGAVLIFRDIKDRLEMEKKLEQMARYDQLTNLANRTLFIELLKNAIARNERTGKKVAVIYMDLNGFKPINDTLGHAAGDIMLKEFAQCLREVVRDSDVAARLGGDEFVIMADSLTDQKECLKLVERLKKRLKKPFLIAGQEFLIGASIGISYFPDHAKDYDDLISFADNAMYQAKKDKSLPYMIYKPKK